MSDPILARWRIVVAYHGAGFVGWQVQPDARSVQGEIEQALSRLLGHPTTVHGSGRTDAGVHAVAQIAAFDTTANRTPDQIRGGLNQLLPPDVACVEARITDGAFDPRRDARRKLYRYSFLDRPARDPLLGDRSWHVRHPLDVDAMHEAAQALVGTHDFTSFRSVGCAAAHPLRTLPAARVVRDAPLVHFEVEGTGFLRHMVRIVAGTLADVGLHRRPVDAVRTAIEARHRDAAGKTAPAHGLTLVWVRYDDEAQEA